MITYEELRKTYKKSSHGEVVSDFLNYIKETKRT